MKASEFSSWLKDPHRRPLVMGVLNVTPDSFSDGGKYLSADSAVEHARKMIDQGAQIIDIGGESSRPGSEPVSPAEQIRRICPVIDRLRGLPAVLSVDTTSAGVAEAALAAGATMLNDISAGRDDPQMLPLAAQRRCPIILMHMQGNPKTMQQSPHYQDVVGEIMGFLEQQLITAGIHGVEGGKILLDPGIGFGKTTAHNLEILRELRVFTTLGSPLVIGTSRKRFIGEILGQSEPQQRIWGSAATIAWGLANGAGIVRVHDVEPIALVVRMIDAIINGPADKQTI